MPMEGLVKFFSPQNAAEVSQGKDIAFIPQKIEVNGDQDSNIKEYIIKNNPVPPKSFLFYCSEIWFRPTFLNVAVQ